jgi:hypothetical protein
MFWLLARISVLCTLHRKHFDYGTEFKFHKHAYGYHQIDECNLQVATDSFIGHADAKTEINVS